MNDQHPKAPPEEATGAGPSLDWIIWPLKESWIRSVAVIVFLAVIVWAISRSFGSIWIFPATVILFLFLAGFFLPTYYHLNGDVIKVRAFLSTKKRDWTALGNYSAGKKGVHLGSQSKTATLLGGRSVYLPYGEKKKEILDFIAEIMDRER